MKDARSLLHTAVAYGNRLSVGGQVTAWPITEDAVARITDDPDDRGLRRHLARTR